MRDWINRLKRRYEIIMYRMSEYAFDSEQDAYAEGGEDGFWRGFQAGKWQATQEIMGWTDKIVDPPSEFSPLGDRYYPINHANPDDTTVNTGRINWRDKEEV